MRKLVHLRRQPTPLILRHRLDQIVDEMLEGRAFDFSARWDRRDVLRRMAIRATLRMAMTFNYRMSAS
jgi:hypothetical protein